MAFVKKTWTDRISEYINRRLLTKEDGSTELVTVARSEGTVSQEGDAFNADNMNDLEERVANEFNALNSSLTELFQSKTVLCENGGGVFIYAKNKNVITLSLSDSTGLSYACNANTFLVKPNDTPFNPSIEQPLILHDTSGNSYYVRVLTTGGIYTPFEIPIGTVLSGVCQFVLS